ncbi:acyl-CoA dehydrogenase family protein [Mycolicibacterium austroafricanum]|jgi:alkylation response protein AidB-like acyl-CoA dehydrogenase|uniref:Acyl-CoA dehydrogenase family protein n=1 Tax=Mycolicibacterium austroafricanum TaxID=39687 RepID=A0ABT8HJ35_MYCAO|nr:acyl-CoA dehydrogenase family protein [Mycolicibacterium austroafricanum]MDN4520776.1 acyl-CoA dehydrogenase family protein [Mycolicibacterium austroafricanum]PQP49818.1 acyl-CoA dehydrogenase [Mycolicibacterium austroafricanum]QRZ09914.1 acyl-CoA dehydrogenase family protein [Mycolicibacterium austroafricanum]QZT59615.1 acyl-CoA dehydrogenase family protein [Mycolicibacterium austroafricanum]QZT71367.1 acyl-CoA dehydrogenase family protein [Mycolicibacterium austroafricanum]
MARTRLVPPAGADHADTAHLRADVRAFLAEQLAAQTFVPSVDSWLCGWDEAFTEALATRGYLGMTVPEEFGGHGRSHIERFVVTEELLAAGAPVAAHWIADRQIVPALLKHGTEAQKREFLPKIAAGKCFFGIGMSEPDSGSDLASVRTRATRTDGGWSLSGTKVWTSGAHRAHAFIVLARTAPADPAHRHDGLSQFIVRFDGPGVEVRPIVSMNGGHHFNEVILDAAFVPEDMVFGEIGDGWSQVTSELSFERSGPERLLSTFPLLAATAESMAQHRISYDAALGRMVARVAGLHQMSTAVAGALERDEPADVPAAVVKLLGTSTEGDIADFADLHTGDETTTGPGFRDLIGVAVDQRPGFTLRGGTTEVLRGVIARGLGMR